MHKLLKHNFNTTVIINIMVNSNAYTVLKLQQLESSFIDIKKLEDIICAATYAGSLISSGH